MATAYRQPFVYTLTGFKWIGRVPGLAYGYEEAIGYCVDPEAVPDKDGVSALIMVLTLAAGLKAEGLSLADRLDEIARRYGIYQTEQVSVRVPDPKIITSAMDRLRARPPRILAGHLTSVHDLAHGSQELPPTNAVLITGEMIKVVVRPSGTEPKLKCYLEVHLGTTSSADIPATRAQARSILATIRSEMSAVLGL
jgi:phosphomannomutase